MKKLILLSLLFTTSGFSQEIEQNTTPINEEHVQGNFILSDPVHTNTTKYKNLETNNDNLLTQTTNLNNKKQENEDNVSTQTTNSNNEKQENSLITDDEIINESELPVPSLVFSKELLKKYNKKLYTSYTLEEANTLANTNFTLKQFHYLQKKLGFSTSKRVGMTSFINIFHIIPDELKEELNLKKFTYLETLKQKTLESGSSKFVVINIPSMQLHTYELNQEKTDYDYYMSSKVIAGALNKKTPSNPEDTFNITGVKFNPNWTVPPAMVKRNILLSDGTINEKYIKSHNLKAVTMADGSVKYRQAPGKDNALGMLKFETDSKKLIFLHDTNERHLFDNNVRYNSSGCIRVKEYLLLAEFLGIQDASQKIEKGRTYIQNTNEKIPVYFTHDLIDIYTHTDLIFLDAYNKNNL